MEAPVIRTEQHEEWGEDKYRLLRRAWRNLWGKKVTLLGLLIVLGVIFCAAFAPWLAPHDPTKQTLELRLKAPFWMEGNVKGYPLGTDHLGRDLLSRLIYGTRVSLLVALASVVISGGLGSLAGLAAGYYRRRTDDVLMRLADVQQAFPSILLAIAVLAVLRPGLGSTIGVLGVTGWVFYARVLRAEVLSLRERDFVVASLATGAKDNRIIFRHILPNTMPSLLVIATLQVPQVIIAESALSFLGLGVQPPAVSWGTMLADSRTYLQTHWWVATWPGLALQFSVLGMNLVGDWLRDVLDPRLKL